ncbi:MAG: LEA type 2 family protein [Bacteroidetes bacterium]|nr:LEA type 2 family protein [Bacteroidota bacterium]
MKSRYSFLATGLIFVLMMIAIPSCDVLKQAEQMANLVNCKFRIQSVQNLNLAGINVQQIKSISDLSLMDAQKLLTAVATGSFPLSMTLNVDAKNPNASSAGMNKLDWILLIDNIEMVRGLLNQRVVIPGNNGTATIPMQLSVDLKKVLKGRSADAIVNFGLNLAGVGNKPTRITLKLKPTITIGQTDLRYPDYITVGTEYQ